MKNLRFISFWLLFTMGLATVVFNACGDDKDDPKQEQNDPKNDPKDDPKNDPFTDKGVVINGVTWATRNVDVPGKFADKPEDAGMFYQWNNKTAWPVTGDITNWNTVVATGRKWKEANDPSPAGWCVPTHNEIKKLVESKDVTYEWITINGIKGGKFTDTTTGNSIFLPALGCRSSISSTIQYEGGGYYWSNEAYTPDDDDAGVYHIGISSEEAGWGCTYRLRGQFIRCVKE